MKRQSSKNNNENTINELDSNGNLIEHKATYEDQRKTPETYTNSFIYDKQQNWIKKISYRNFIAEKITERKIIYY